MTTSQENNLEKPSSKKAILPPLPRKIFKREADATPHILKWFRENRKESCAIEIKATDRDTIAESVLAPHQRAALLAVSEVFTHKIADAARLRTPFDAFMFYRDASYVVAVFTTHRVAQAYRVHDWHGARIGDTSRAAFWFNY